MKNFVKRLIKHAKSVKTQVSLKLTAIAVGVMAATPAMAADSVSTAITAAVNAGKSNVGLVVAGSIAMGALLFGLGSIMGVFKKS